MSLVRRTYAAHIRSQAACLRHTRHYLQHNPIKRYPPRMDAMASLASRAASSLASTSSSSSDGKSSSVGTHTTATGTTPSSKDTESLANGSAGKAFHQITTHQQYHAPPLDLASLKSSPIEQFSEWFSEAQSHGVPEPEAVSIATVDAETLQPSVRVVLLKQVDERGFVFFTNYQSRKGRELGMSPDLDRKEGNKAAACWYWRDMHRSVRVVGKVERVSPEESYEYYRTRPIGSQIGAHASPQSRVVQDRQELEHYVEQFEDKFGIERGSATRKADDEQDKGKTVPLPQNWGGVRIVPTEVEFWVGRENRLHDRARYLKQDDGSWKIDRLAP